MKSSVLRWSVVFGPGTGTTQLQGRSLENSYRLAFLSVFFWISPVATPSRQQKSVDTVHTGHILEAENSVRMMENGPVGTIERCLAQSALFPSVPMLLCFFKAKSL